MEIAKQINEVVIAPARHGDDEFERLAAAEFDRLQRFKVVQTEQSAVGNENQPAYRRKARQDGRKDGQQCLGAALP